MKKFLTVLLALSVVFTYSFGTVFAATDESTFNGNVNQAEANVMATLSTNYDNMLKTIVADDTAQGIAASKEAWMAAAATVKADQEALVKARTNEIKTSYSALQDKTMNEIVLMYSEAAGGSTHLSTTKPAITQDDLYTATYANDDVAARYQFEADKTAALDAIKSVDLSIYSTTTPTTGDTYYAQAKAIVDAAITSISAITITSTSNDDAVAGELAKFGVFKVEAVTTDGTVTGTAINAGSGTLGNFSKYVQEADNDVVVKYVLVQNIKTIAGEAADATTLEAKKGAYIARVNANAANYLVDNTSATGDKLAKVNAERAAYVAGMTEIINAATKESELTAIADSVDTIATPDAVNFYYTANAEKIAQLEATAAKYKVYKDANGNLVKDADEINKVVAAAKVAAYKANDEWTDDASAKIVTSCGAISLDDFAIKAEKAAIEAGRKAALEPTSDDDAYYALEAAKVNALLDALLAKVDAAKTTEEVKDVYTSNSAVTGLSAIDKKTATRTKIEALASFTTNRTALTAYMGYVNANLNIADDGYKNIDLTDAIWSDFYAENNARTDAEVAALLDAAKASADSTPTTKALKDQKAAVEAMISALPSTITANDAAAVKAAWDAFTAYNKATGKTASNTDVVNSATLGLDVTAAYNAEKKVIEDQITALPAAVKITIADKAAVKAAADAKEAFNDKTKTGEIYAAKAKADTGDKVGGLVTAIKNLEKAAIVDAINALPLNVTLADKAAVEAARALYDAYVAEYSDPENNTNAASDFTGTPDYYKVLAEAEAEITALEPTVSVKDVAGKATTKKVGKKVRVYFKNIPQEIKDLGDSAYIQVWKSKNAVKYNFSKRAKITAASTLISKTYNGKNYVKFRVVVVNEDGTKTFSPWSTVGCRIIKK